MYLSFLDVRLEKINSFPHLDIDIFNMCDINIVRCTKLTNGNLRQRSTLLKPQRTFAENQAPVVAQVARSSSPRANYKAAREQFSFVSQALAVRQGCGAQSSKVCLELQCLHCVHMGIGLPS
jgi:hypothetical protein